MMKKSPSTDCLIVFRRTALFISVNKTQLVCGRRGHFVTLRRVLNLGTTFQPYGENYIKVVSAKPIKAFEGSRP